MEAPYRIRSHSTALNPSVYTALGKQDVSLAARVYLVFDAVITAREINRGLNDRLQGELGVIDINPDYPDLNLGELGSRSLGELLFSDRAFTRGAIQVCRYPAPWLPSAVRNEQLWARRSCFQRGALAVLVAEVFLPQLWQAAHVDA